MMERRRIIAGLSTLLAASVTTTPSFAFQVESVITRTNGAPKTQYNVAYKPLVVTIEEASVDVPVACWFPRRKDEQAEGMLTAVSIPTYQHRISVRKIGQMLANWNIPSFVCRDFALQPTSDFVEDGTNLPLPTMKAPVVLLAHGYLGSRFDFSHLAEVLAEQGFICIAAEYPESLAASYDPQPGLDRRRINQALLETLQNKWKMQPSAFGIVGHSLGCGTALQTGDQSWTRVLIAGFPRQRDGRPVPGNMLFLTSKNDSLVNRFLVDKNAMFPDFTLLDESSVLASREKIPRRAAIIFDRPNAPNHISFLTESVNDAMVEFLSPLLPVARWFSIPVLDFDRYQQSRDARVTADVVHPIILRYLIQEMGASRD